MFICGCIVLGSDASGTRSGQDSPAGEATRDSGWDAAFTRTDGWTAGDIGHSLAIPGGRTLWLFGDSFAGPIEDGKRVPDGTTMVRGAVAWHATPAQGGPPGEIEFALASPWREAAVVDWARPAQGLWPEGTWYWLMNDGAAARDGEGSERFVLFTTAVGPAGNPEGMWNFRRVGGAILIVENPRDPPAQWRVEQRRNPLVGENERHGEPRRATENWGLAIVASAGAQAARGTAGAAGPGGGASELYVFGIRTDEQGHHALLVAWCNEATLHEPQSWRFYDGQRWSERPAEAGAVAGGLIDEFTIQWVVRGGEAMLVLIQSEPFFGRRILARTARRPEGPWSEPKAVFEVVEPANDRRLMTYAAKGHAPLSRPGELLVSYVINSSDFGQIVNDPSLYRPRFIRIPLAMLPDPP